MLKDLNQLALEAKKRRDEFDDREIKLSAEFKKRYKAIHPKSLIVFKEFTSIDFTPQNLTIIIPNQWFIIASFFTEYLEALLEYKSLVTELGLPKQQIPEFKNQKTLPESVVQLIEKKLDVEDARRFQLFLTDYSWWFGAKTIDRQDFVVSSILNLASVVNIAQGHIATLTHTLYKSQELVDLLYESLDENKIDVSDNLKNEFASWLIDNPKHKHFDNDIDKTIKILGKYEVIYDKEFDSKLFEPNFTRIDEEIERIRENIFNDNTEFWKYSKNHATHQPRAVLGTENYLRFLKEYSITKDEDRHFQEGYNKIYFGAPGTGKSYAVTQLLKENAVPESRIERVTFHPDYDYNSFVGGYKPVTEINEKDEAEVNYRFVPQVFTNIYIKAHQQPDRNFYLVIEEINRGNCAEIFGDVFQLLDRNPDYDISPSEDLKKHLLAEDINSVHKTLINGKMIMPTNLILLATMNTSDQSLYPMDSAFKRRWKWEYIPIHLPMNEKDDSCPSYHYRIAIDDKTSLSWIHFVAQINSHIVRNPSLGMDKCLGNFFIKPVSGNEIGLADFIHKVMFYLWNDVFKDEDNDIFKEQTYLDYFPLETNGVKRMRELIEKLDLKSSTVEIPTAIRADQAADESYLVEGEEETS